MQKTLSVASLLVSFVVGCNGASENKAPAPQPPRLDETLRAGIPADFKFGTTTLAAARQRLETQGYELREFSPPRGLSDTHERILRATPKGQTALPHGAKELSLSFYGPDETKSDALLLGHAALKGIEDAHNVCADLLKEFDDHKGSMEGCEEPRTLESYWLRCAATEDGALSLAVDCAFGNTGHELSIGMQDY